MKYPSEILERLVTSLSDLPGIGEKSAQRIALYLFRDGRQQGEQLAKVLHEMKDKVGQCSVCFNITEVDPCQYCSDTKRDQSIICVLEDTKDLLAIERTGEYHGMYHLLGGALSPLDGIGEEELHVKELIARITSNIKEVILATNPTIEGEMTASFLAQRLHGKEVKVTRIARGVPFGGTLEFNDMVTLSKSLEGRTLVD
ncbi:recombination protein RecR [candidate division KSB1 bacterium]|nr:recombination protein RecR [candidate division KSB1 bacterium]